MTASSTSPAVIRRWARDNGLQVGERGRLSPQLLLAYANSQPPKPHASKSAQPTAPEVAPHRPDGRLRIAVRPTPRATGIACRVVARSS